MSVIKKALMDGLMAMSGTSLFHYEVILVDN